MRAVLKGEPLAPVDALLEIVRSRAHGALQALDWLLERQNRGCVIGASGPTAPGRGRTRALRPLLELPGSGSACSLAQRGCSRDDKKGKPQVDDGLLTDARACPVSISVFAGNTADTETPLEQVDTLQGRFVLESVIVVGDRGMISQKQIDAADERSGVDWIKALKSGAIRKLVDAV